MYFLFPYFPYLCGKCNEQTFATSFGSCSVSTYKNVIYFILWILSTRFPLLSLGMIIDTLVLPYFSFYISLLYSLFLSLSLSLSLLLFLYVPRPCCFLLNVHPSQNDIFLSRSKILVNSCTTPCFNEGRYELPMSWFYSQLI